MALSSTDSAMATGSELSSPSESMLSSPLSTPPNSPSPPPEMPELPAALRAAAYPSPPSSQQTSQSGSPAPDGMKSSQNRDSDGPPPAKRRRISKEPKEPKERSTEYLDLRSSEIDPEEQVQLDRLLNVLHNRQKIVVIAGAGMSVSAGIPDFRSSTGLFKSLKEEHKLKGSGKHLFDASVYRDDSSTSSFHTMVSSMSRMTKDAKPTAFHHMLATIAKENRLLRLYSQNVDGIDTGLEPLKTNIPLRKGEDGKWPRTVQLHGGLDTMVCSKCSDLSEFDPNLFEGPVPPACQKCVEVNDLRTNLLGRRSHGIGRLRPRMVLYNEHNPDDEAIGSVTRDDLRKRPDAVIVVGTTLKVPGVRRIVREMCGIVRDRRGGVAVWLNNDLPPVAKDLEDCFDIVVQGTCDAVAEKAAMCKWDDPVDSDEFSEVSDAEAQKANAKTLKVHVPAASVEREYVESVELPSESHYNNSFSPPPVEVSTPRKQVKDRPMDWSPITQHKGCAYPSIEPSSQGNAAVTSGLLTPSKSRKNTPADSSVSINDKLKDAGKTKNAGAKGKAGKGTTAKPKKASNVKFVKPASKPAAGGKTGSLTSAFTTTKTASVEAKTSMKIKSQTSPTKSPSKLSQVLNASPHKPAPFFPGFASENAFQNKEGIPIAQFGALPRVA